MSEFNRIDGKEGSVRAELVEAPGRTGSGATSEGMSFWVYILRCADGSYYTGHTDDLEARVAKHQSGEMEGYTTTRLPLTLVFSEDFPTRAEALERERQIKGWSRCKKEALIRRDWEAVVRLARGKSPSTSSGRTGGDPS
jgi:putative endonuclease